MDKQNKLPIFQCKISNCGTNFYNSTFGIVKEKNALKLLASTNECIANEFMGKEKGYQLIYHCSIYLLSLLMKDEDYKKKFPEYPKEKLEKIVNDYQYRLKS